MSYDIFLYKDSNYNRDNVVCLPFKHDVTGGTYAVGGTSECRINITYNYSKFYYQFSDKGIREFYGMVAKDSIPILINWILSLKNDVDDDYWKPTEGNAKMALINMLQLALLAPEGVWYGD